MRTSPAETVVLLAVGALFGCVSCLFARALVRETDERLLLGLLLGLLLAAFVTGVTFVAVAFAVVLA